MIPIKFMVEDQELTCTNINTLNIVGDTIGQYEAVLEFNEWWDGYVPIVRFTKYGISHDRPVLNGVCSDFDAVLTGSGSFEVTVFALDSSGNRKTTNTLSIPVTSSGLKHPGTAFASSELEQKLLALLQLLLSSENVIKYGAKGDGVTDDTAAIRAARDAARISKRPLYFPSGTYILSGCIQLYSGMHVIGDGATLRKKEAITQEIISNRVVEDTVIYVPDASPYEVGQDCYIGARGADNYGDTVAYITAINKATNAITIRAYPRHKVSTDKPVNYGVARALTAGSAVFSSTFPLLCTYRYDDPGSNITIEGLYFDGNKQADEPKTYQLSPIHTDPGGDNITVRDCVVINSNADGVSIQSDTNITVENCIVKNTSYHGIHVGFTISGVTVTGCKVYDAPECGFYDCYAVKNLSVIGNAFFRCRIGCGGFDLESRGSVVSGNTYEDCNTGVKTGAAYGLVITGNAFRGTGKVNLIGVSAHTTENAIITGNTFYNLRNALYLQAAEKINFSNNTVRDCVAPIVTAKQSASGGLWNRMCSFSNNTVYGSTGAAVNIGYAEDMMVTGNVIDGSANIVIDRASTYNIFCSNNIIGASLLKIQQSEASLYIASGVDIVRTGISENEYKLNIS